jgi:hypothetical protein
MPSHFQNMLRSMFGKWWKAPEGVLTRLEGLGLRRWLYEAARDWRFALSIVVLAGLGLAGLNKMVALMTARPGTGPILAAGFGFAVFRLAFIAPGSSRWRQLRSGVLHPWTAFGPALRRWVHARAAVITLGVCLMFIATVLAIRPAAALACGTGMGVGAALAAATSALRPFRGVSFTPVRPRLNLNLFSAMPPSVRAPLADTFRRKVGAIPVWLLSCGLWTLATPASALATHNTPGAPIGFGLITATGLICGLTLAWPNLRLIRFLAFHPIPMRRIVAPLCGPQVGLVAVLALAAAIGAGQPFGLAAASAAVVTGGVCLWLVLLVPYAMTRSPGGAVAMAACELVVAVIVKFALQFGVVAAGWLIARAIVNIRAVSRNRWREPS